MVHFFYNANTKSMLQIEPYFVKEVMNECVKWRPNLFQLHKLDQVSFPS